MAKGLFGMIGKLVLAIEDWDERPRKFRSTGKSTGWFSTSMHSAAVCWSAAMAGN